MLTFILLFLITILYSFLLLGFLYGWKKTPDFQLKTETPKNNFSIIVPFRNEAKNLPGLFQSLTKLNYPAHKFEILLVDDDSRDDSKLRADAFKLDFSHLKIQVIENKRLSTSPKKDAIQTAISHSSFEYILTTDADCMVPENWLSCYDLELQSQVSKMIAGPVGFIQDTGKKKALFQSFEELDFLSLQATTVGAFGLGKAFLCNGANLCYEKEAFIKHAGFNKHQEIASGDDVFLLQQFQDKNIPVSFLKSQEALVKTRLQPDLKGLINQRIRWAAKTTSYNSFFAKYTAAIVFFMNLSILVYGFLALFSLFPYQYFMLIFLIKFNLDAAMIYLAAKFIKREAVMRNYFWSSLIYPFFSVGIALLSLFKGFEWKGRSFKK